MVYLGVNMIGTSGKNNSPVSCFVEESNGFLTFFAHIVPARFKLNPGFMNSSFNFFCCEIKLWSKLFDQAGRKGFLAGKGHERMDEIHVAVYDGINIIFDVLRIGGNNRTVIVVVGIGKFISLIRNRRVKDMPDAFIDQPLYMPVGKFGGITFRFTWDRLNSQLINLPCGSGRENYTKSKIREECEPERIVIVHIQNSGYTDHAAGSFLL